MAMLSLRALECLVATVEHGSLTRAAVKLRTSQPALSHQLAALERELGTPVIERLPRGIRPTAAGLAAAAEARIALAAADRAVLAGRRAAAGAGGRIRIASAENMTAWVLGPVLRSPRRPVPRCGAGPGRVHQRGHDARGPPGRAGGHRRRTPAHPEAGARRGARAR